MVLRLSDICRHRLMGATLCSLVGLIAGCQKAPVAQAPPKNPEVLVVTPVHQTITEFEEFTGRTAAVKMVDVRARVSGYLKSVDFKDGAMVNKGDTLFHIDDQSFTAELKKAGASVAQYEARLERHTRQEKRTRQLTQTGAIPQDEYETIVSDKNEAQASLDSAKADVILADLNLSYTKVEAPISGRISRRLVDAGNLVTADSSILATIVATNPIYVYFDMDERTVLRMKRLVRDGEIKPTRESDLQVQISLADETDFTHTGTVDFVDNQVDAATGTLRYRAEIANEDQFYSPGLFVRLRFPIGKAHGALLVPEEALGTDQGQRFVYVVDGENKVAYRRVKTGILLNGKRVIKEGVESGDKVIVTGLQRVRPGIEVTPKTAGESEDPAAKTAVARPAKTKLANAN